MHKLLVEIGCEEIPASFLAPAAADLERRVLDLLSDRGIAAGPARVLYTPRRLALLVDSVAEGRPAQVVELQGPPRKAAFDAEGRPTRTAQGFSAAHGKTPADLYLKTTAKGEYVFIRKETAPEPTHQVLGQQLAGIIRALPFPKNMRWNSGGVRFARPIRWLVCLLGPDVVPVRLDGLVASNRTEGLRTGQPRSLDLPGAEAYEQTLAAHRVIASHAARRETITARLNTLAAEVSGRPVLDEELLDETTDITESPELLLASFAEEHLSLPAEVLITALKKHQRCFAIRQDMPDSTGESDRVPTVTALLPRFVAVANNPDCDHASVTAWYEKAAESRLRDARFFFSNDLSRGLESQVQAEQQVTWIEGMGTYFDKTERLRELCRHLAARVPGVDAAALDRAARLSKADLLTDMVREKEYTSLQGVMGGIYARLLGEPAPVADAIADQYRPRFIGDELPRTVLGALLSITDKVDNIVATFLTGAIPSGSEDPFALRRQATGLLTMVLDRSLSVDVKDLVDTAAAAFPDANPQHKARLPDFFRERLSALLADRGIRYDAANAVMEDFWPVPTQAMARARALVAFRSQPGFEQLIVGQKRVANILRGLDVAGRPEPDALVEPTERLLWQESQALEPALDEALAASAYDKAFELLLGLRSTIDKFFDDVLVMAKDEQVRTNRLRLLACVRSLFRRVADLSRIVLEGEEP